MTEPVTALFDQAFRVTLLLSLPVILMVGGIGIAMGLLQTILQIQDQNVSFAPKILALSLLIAVAGMTGLEALQTLLQTVMQLAPVLARA